MNAFIATILIFALDLFSAYAQPAYVEFIKPDYRAAEDAGFGTVAIRRWGNTNTAFQLDWYARGGSAVAGADFVGVTNTLSFAPGETNKTITVTLVDDGLVEEAESILLTFGVPTAGAGMGSITNASLIIHDNEIPSLVDGSYNPIFAPDNDVFAVVVQPDGKILVGGEFGNLRSGTNSIARSAVARFNADGSPDLSFAATGEADGGVYTLALQPDGKVLAGGGFNGTGWSGRRFLARLNPDGSVDTSFLPAVNDEIRAIVVQPDKKILIAGRFTMVNGQSCGRIARLNPDGALDDTFNPGTNANNHIRTMVLQNDGRILIGGQFTTYNGISRVRVARLEANGALDTSFNPGTGADDQIRAIALAKDGFIYLGGEFNTYNGSSCPALIRVFPNGDQDFGFNAGLHNADTIRSLLVQPDGCLLAGGWFHTVWGVARTNFARFFTNGHPDANLLSAHGPNNEVFAIALQSDDAIIIGGQFSTVGGVIRPRVARLLPDSRVTTVEYAAAEIPAAETWTQVTIPVRRAGQSSNAVTATWFTSDGTAWAGFDYLPVTNALQFAPLQVTNSFVVPIINDSDISLIQTVRLLVRNVVHAAPGAWREAALLIINGNGYGTIRLQPLSLSESESNGQVLVQRSGPTNLPVMLYFSTRDGTALAGVDYQVASGVFELAAGKNYGYIQVHLINDSIREGSEDFHLDLRESLDGPVVASTSVTIRDNESGITLLGGDVSLNENAGTAAFQVHCAWDPASPVEVDFVTRDLSSATAGLDYLPQAGTLIFTNYGQAHLITVPIINDGFVEGPETLAIELTALRGPAALLTTNRVMTIVDNDQGIEFVTNLVSAGESDGVTWVAVRRRDDGANSVTVDFETEDGSATAGADYTATNGTLLLFPGTDWQWLAIPIQGDAVVESDETFQVRLSHPTSGASLGAVTSAVVRLIENNRPGTLNAGFILQDLPPYALQSFGGLKLAMQPDNKALVGGYGAIIRLHENGALDRSWVGEQRGYSFVPAVQPDGRILAGTMASNGLVTDRYINRYLANGDFDPTFATQVRVGGTAAVAVQSDGRILTGGIYYGSSYAGEATNNAVQRFETNGALDTNFNAGLFLPWGSTWGWVSTVEALVIQPDGRILAAGEFTNVAGNACDSIVRLDTNGSVDGSFHLVGTHAPVATHTVFALALQPDGRILAGGSFTNLQGGTGNSLTRLHPNGLPDPSFRAPFEAGAVVRAIIVQPDGRIVVGGGPLGWSSGANNFVVRLNADGSIDETFDIGQPPDGAVTDLALYPNGDALVAGEFTVFNGLPRPKVVRLVGGALPYSRLAIAPTNLTLAESDAQVVFNVRRSGETNWTTTVGCRTAAGTASAGDDYSPVNVTLTYLPGETNKTIIVPIHDDWLFEDDETFRLELSNPAGDMTVLLQVTANVTMVDDDRPGSVDNEFAASTDLNGEVLSMVVQPDGRILVAGTFYQVNGVAGPAYCRLNPDGTLDSTFDRGTGGYDRVRALALQSDGRVLIGGDFASVLGAPRISLARVFPDGAVDPSFTSPLTSQGNLAHSVTTIALQPDERVLIGGYYSLDSSLPNYKLMRLLSDGAPDPAFAGPIGFSPVSPGVIVPLASGQILIGGGFTAIGSHARSFLARLNPDGTLDTSFGAGAEPNAPVSLLIVLPDGRMLIAGGFDLIGDAYVRQIARLLPDGTLDPDTPRGFFADQPPRKMLRQPDGRLVIIGAFTNVNGRLRSGVARLNPDLTLDESVDLQNGPTSAYDARINTAALAANGDLLIAGYFDAVSGLPAGSLARLRGEFLPHVSPAVTPAPDGVALSLFSQPGATYVIEASTDLANWVPVRTNVASTNVLNLIAPATPDLSRQFYRAWQSTP